MRLKEKILYIVICVVVTVIARFIDSTPFGFGYSGIYLLFFSAAICGLALTLPDAIHGKLRVMINYVGACTMGIYCLHINWVGDYSYSFSNTGFGRCAFL